MSCGLRERLSSIKPVLAVAGRLYIIIVAVCGSVHPMMHTDKNRPKQPSKKKKTTKSDRTKWTRKNWHKSWYSVRISWSLPMTDGQTGLDFIPRQVQHVLNSNVLNSMCVCVWLDEICEWRTTDCERKTIKQTNERNLWTERSKIWRLN